jgi:hypothetical protein
MVLLLIQDIAHRKANEWREEERLLIESSGRKKNERLYELIRPQ